MTKFHTIGLQETPIFRLNLERYVLFYTPGYLAAVSKEGADDFGSGLKRNCEGNFGEIAHKLQTHALRAKSSYRQYIHQKFHPVCLTLYVNNTCNSACSYCYSNLSENRKLQLSLDEIRAGALLVAQNCKAQQIPFTVVFHGGGEPTLDQRFLDQVLDEVGSIGKELGTPLFRYIATNGVMSPEKASWLAERFDLVGISCDGPEDIQTRQRPLIHGSPSTSFVERTAQLLREAGTPFNVRVTLTPQTYDRQGEIAAYICEILRPENIHVEWVYTGGRTKSEAWNGFDRAQQLVAYFIKAQALARTYGVDWRHAGSRVNDLHGPYCHIYRQVLNLVPGGVATNCFKLTTAGEVNAAGQMIAHYDPVTDKCIVQAQRVNDLYQVAPGYDNGCSTCFNQFHCVGLCPDTCGFQDKSSISNFRCRVQQMLAQHDLIQFAEEQLVPNLHTNTVSGMELPVSW